MSTRHIHINKASQLHKKATCLPEHVHLHRACLSEG